LGTFTAWIGIIAYSFQIYFDFSAYSDMAIGLGRMFGFKFLENFNFPYIAKSIREFWYRWHISLSNWFRDYLYISLGGNRRGTTRTYLNLFIVFLITGFWHGASWTFIVWGLIHGLFMIIEKLGFDRILEKLWSPIRYFYTLFVVVMAWVVFRAETFDEALGFYHSLFIYKSSDLNADILMNFFNIETYIVAIIALLGSARVFTLMGEKMNMLQLRFSLRAQKNILVIVDVVELMAIAFVMLMVSMYLVAGTYNPFIYFRF
ncbi:MAG: MBOAT family protein, partial [Bacteroidales bacterium]|nr:MBOAT family protein [Bacteroidales bacterium]